MIWIMQLRKLWWDKSQIQVTYLIIVLLSQQFRLIFRVKINVLKEKKIWRTKIKQNNKVNVTNDKLKYLKQITISCHVIATILCHRNEQRRNKALLMKLHSGVTKYCKSQRQQRKEIQNKDISTKKHTVNKWRSITLSAAAPFLLYYNMRAFFWNICRQ